MPTASFTASLKKASLIDPELAKKLILALHREDTSQAIEMILEALLPQEEAPEARRSCRDCYPGPHEERCNTCHERDNWYPFSEKPAKTPSRNYCVSCVNEDTPFDEPPCDECSGYSLFKARTCQNCDATDKSGYDVRCNSCDQYLSNWKP